MNTQSIELADVVRQFGDEYLARFGHCLMPSQRKALRDIASCCTPEMGGQRYHCQNCNRQFWIYHGCRNRSCPKCHQRQTRQWLESRQTELLPCDYFHLVATIPEELRHIFLSNQKEMYGLFIKTVAQVILDLTASPKHLEAVPAIMTVLHTWTAEMMYHPHVHVLVSAGGVSNDGRHWRSPRGKFLVPVKTLSKVVAARIRDAIRTSRPDLFRKLPSQVWRREWCSFCKPYGRGNQAVVNYLSRYVFRIALTNTRILDVDDTHVTFRIKDRHKQRWKIRRLSGVEFLRRFLMHVLPRGLHKVRYYGLWHHSKRQLNRRARLLLLLRLNLRTTEVAKLIAGLLNVESFDPSSSLTTATTLIEPPLLRCPHCQADHITLIAAMVRGP